MAPGAPLPDVLSETVLIFLTLDVRPNQPNSPTSLDLDFYNESAGDPSANTNFEKRLSTFWEFVCWGQAQLSTINSNLTQALMGTRKGIVIAGPAQKVRDGNAPGDPPGPVTLIGLVETIEGTAANGFQERKYNFNMYNDGTPVTTGGL